MARSQENSTPYIDFDRDSWRSLRRSMPQVLSEAEVMELRGIGERVDLEEVAEVYLPLSRLINFRVQARQQLTNASASFLGEKPAHTPFIIAIAGSVAVGKSTTARLLQVLLQRWESTPRVDLVTTDGFLYPTAELERRGLLDRKGFPESYDRRALLRFLTEVKAGQRRVHAPMYSHTLYDRVPDQVHTIDLPDILIIEGLNVLQTSPTLTVSDLFDFSIYVDAHTHDIERWYMDRFMQLRESAFRRPDSHFSHLADIPADEARDFALRVWQSINLPNLVENILPTRVRASLVLKKGSDHQIQKVRMRKM